MIAISQGGKPDDYRVTGVFKENTTASSKQVSLPITKSATMEDVLHEDDGPAKILCHLM